MFANLKFKIFHKCKLQKITLKCFKYGKKIKFSNNLLKIRLQLVLQCMVERLLIKPSGFFFFFFFCHNFKVEIKSYTTIKNILQLSIYIMYEHKVKTNHLVKRRLTLECFMKDIFRGF